MSFADFDGVRYHLANVDGAKNSVRLSMAMRAIADCMPFGVADCINGLYGNYVVDTEATYDVSLVFNIDTLPAAEDARKAIARTAALLKRNLISVPFEAFFDQVGQASPAPVTEIKYRPNESFWIMSDRDKCTVVFNVDFSDKDDVVLGNVFLQEFKNVRRNIPAAPPVSFTVGEPPLELQNVRGVRAGPRTGFITFVFFPNHFDAGHRQNTITNIANFRTYLQYHIKCAKAYLHTRMRKRVVTLLKILNRAKMEPKKKEKKTATGRTFKRA